MNAVELKKAEAKAKRDALELAMLQQIRGLRLTAGMEREHEFAKPRKWRLDFAWPARKIALEVEGGVFSGGRHTRGSGFTEDCAKYNAAALDGWLVLRVTSGHIRTGQAANWLEDALREGVTA